MFLLLHLPYLPASLEDVDSINFALGVRHYDVAHHQPHPPGYPLFIVFAKGMRLLVGTEAHALALVGILAGALGAIAVAMLFRRLDGDPRAWLAGTAIAVATPLYWFSANRPLSDTTGLAAAIAVQALILSAATPRALIAAAFLGAVAVGLRSQVFWLTAPLLLWRLSRTPNPKSRITTVVAYAAGVLVWAVPLVVVSGGPRAYWHAVFDQGAEDFSGIRMLWTTRTPRELSDALYYAFVAPWALWPFAAVILALATLGAVALGRARARALTLVAIAFVPYFVFDVLFQETFTSRYALPLVVPIAFLAAAGARALPSTAGTAVAIAAAMFGAHLGGTSLAGYARQPAPAFRLLADMRRDTASSTDLPVVGMDRREALDLRRPTTWIGSGSPAFAAQLPSPPQHEWLEPVKYWRSGGRAPVWFVADPHRTDIDLIQHRPPQRYRWTLPYPVLIGGVRPNEMDWYELTAPEWYLDEGWALTPEVAGVADRDDRTLARGPIRGWLRADVLHGALVIGGREFDPSARPRITVAAGDSWSQTFAAAPGFFLRSWPLPRDAVVLSAGRYVPVTVTADGTARVAIEQFDASASRTVFGYADGWNEQEYNPDTGLRWRWMSERGDLQVRWQTNGAAILRLDGESPRKYFARGSRLTIEADGRTVFDEVLSSDFSLHVPLAQPVGTITLQSDQFYVPAERTRRSRDRRHLALRIFNCEIVAASAPDR